MFLQLLPLQCQTTGDDLFKAKWQCKVTHDNQQWEYLQRFYQMAVPAVWGTALLDEKSVSPPIPGGGGCRGYKLLEHYSKGSKNYRSKIKLPQSETFI